MLQEKEVFWNVCHNINLLLYFRMLCPFNEISEWKKIVCIKNKRGNEWSWCCCSRQHCILYSDIKWQDQSYHSMFKLVHLTNTASEIHFWENRFLSSLEIQPYSFLVKVVKQSFVWPKSIKLHHRFLTALVISTS